MMFEIRMLWHYCDMKCICVISCVGAFVLELPKECLEGCGGVPSFSLGVL